MFVRDLMTPRVVSVTPSDTLGTARLRLRENRIHHLLVMQGSDVVGVLTYRDMMGKDDARRVGDTMLREIVTVTPWETARNAASKMLGRTQGCLPVVEGDRVTGIITTTDLLRAVSLPRTA